MTMRERETRHHRIQVYVVPGTFATNRRKVIGLERGDVFADLERLLRLIVALANEMLALKRVGLIEADTQARPRGAYDK